MQYGAPAHTAGSTLKYLGQKHVRILSSPGNSPDLNPIENVFFYMVRQMPQTLPLNQNDLWARVQLVGHAVPKSLVHSLIR